MKKQYIIPTLNVCSQAYVIANMLVSSPGTGENNLGSLGQSTNEERGLDNRNDEGIGTGTGDALSKNRFYGGY